MSSVHHRKTARAEMDAEERPALHLVKLCVGVESLEEMIAWRARRSAELQASTGDPRTRHVTRMWPKREAELLAGGSLYWVIKGVIRARQRLSALEEVLGEDGVRRCALVLEPALHRTEAAPRRAFQGWRYLPAGDAPRDLATHADMGEALPAPLMEKLRAVGVL